MECCHILLTHHFVGDDCNSASVVTSSATVASSPIQILSLAPSPPPPLVPFQGDDQKDKKDNGRERKIVEKRVALADLVGKQCRW